MKEITISANDAGRRLDRFLRKYLPGASLSEIYKIIRKDAKVNGKRKSESYMLCEGDVLSLYISDDDLDSYMGSADKRTPVKRSFGIIYEDSDVLIVNKPWGLLTHGDSREKKNHLANQVKDYLIAKGDYNPQGEKVFTPAPANRLDRNTSGIVLFGKTSAAMRELNSMIRDGRVRKFYTTLTSGLIEDELWLTASLTKNEASNRVSVGSTGDKEIATVIRPIETYVLEDAYDLSLVEAELITGRTHQIRAHLSSVGYPIVGDSKYATPDVRELNRYAKETLGISTQLLHACRIEFGESEVLSGVSGRTFEAELPLRFKNIIERLEV